MAQTRRVRVEDLVLRLNDAQQRMSKKNSHRRLMADCQEALIQLARRVGESSRSEERPDAPDTPEAV